MAEWAAELAELRAELAELRARLDPQRIRNDQERTWDPRGGEPRLVDSTGRTLDYAPAIQFTGATTTLDAGKQRAIVAITPPELRGTFSADSTVSDAERLRFVDASDGVTRRFSVDTSTSGNTKSVTARLSDTGITTGLRSETIYSVATGGVDIANHTLGAYSAAGHQADVHMQAHSGGAFLNLTAKRTGSSGYTGIHMTGNVAGASSILFYVGTTGGISGASRLEFDDDFLELSLPGVPARRFLGLGTVSHFMQTHPATNNETTAVKRVTRGPFTVSVAALGAGLSTSGTLSFARAGTDYVVVGGPNGAAGSEDLSWSWTDSGSDAVTINVTNNSSVARTATLRFYVISTA